MGAEPYQAPRERSPTLITGPAAGGRRRPHRSLRMRSDIIQAISLAAPEQKRMRQCDIGLALGPAFSPQLCALPQERHGAHRLSAVKTCPSCPQGLWALLRKLPALHRLEASDVSSLCSLLCLPSHTRHSGDQCGTVPRWSQT